MALSRRNRCEFFAALGLRGTTCNYLQQHFMAFLAAGFFLAAFFAAGAFLATVFFLATVTPPSRIIGGLELIVPTVGGPTSYPPLNLSCSVLENHFKS
jgi:hypothetical protein